MIGLNVKHDLMINASIDAIAEENDVIEVEIQKEIGFKDLYKLYIHVNGVTVLRFCKLKEGQIQLSFFTETLKEDKKL